VKVIKFGKIDLWVVLAVYRSMKAHHVDSELGQTFSKVGQRIAVKSGYPRPCVDGPEPDFLPISKDKALARRLYITVFARQILVQAAQVK